MSYSDFMPKSPMKLPEPGSRFYDIPAHLVITSPYYAGSTMKTTEFEDGGKFNVSEHLHPGEMTKAQLCAYANFSSVTVNAAMKRGDLVPDRYVGVQAVFAENTISDFIHWVEEDRKKRSVDRKRQHEEAKSKIAVPLSDLRTRNANIKKMRKEYSYLYRSGSNFTYEESN